ncbi:NUDIX hydrolase [Tolumonas lignilytica]|uniref:NUDIX hydrolase n=1 Tax=Tolumonas lignilytica TaxID=1283284 RepID=UPI0004675319|nr:NUDIX domain-containing protein [Tolumonas lignilytica]
MITTIDTVLLRIADNELQVLLWQRPSDSRAYPGFWALPGGWVFEDRDETLEQATCRILERKAGLKPDYIEQVATIGNRQRDPDGWSMTVLHLALLRFSCSSSTHEDTHWVPVENVLNQSQELAFDHAVLLAKALERLNTKARYSTLPLYLAEQELKLPELQRIYEIVLGNPLHKRAFRERILSADVLQDTGRRVQGRGSPATIYRYHSDCPVRLFDRMMQGASTETVDE